MVNMSAKLQIRPTNLLQRLSMQTAAYNGQLCEHPMSHLFTPLLFVSVCIIIIARQCSESPVASQGHTLNTVSFYLNRFMLDEPLLPNVLFDARIFRISIYQHCCRAYILAVNYMDVWCSLYLNCCLFIRHGFDNLESHWKSTLTCLEFLCELYWCECWFDTWFLRYLSIPELGLILDIRYFHHKWQVGLDALLSQSESTLETTTAQRLFQSAKNGEHNVPGNLCTGEHKHRRT